MAVEWPHLGRDPPRVRTGRADRGVDVADVALNWIGHGREFREHQPRVIDRGPAAAVLVKIGLELLQLVQEPFGVDLRPLDDELPVGGVPLAASSIESRLVAMEEQNLEL